MTKKVYIQEFYPVITKNWNWEILTKNWLFSKDKMGWRIKNFNILGVHGKIQVFEGRFTKNPYIEGAWMGGVVFLRGWIDTPMHTMGYLYKNCNVVITLVMLYFYFHLLKWIYIHSFIHKYTFFLIFRPLPLIKTYCEKYCNVIWKTTADRVIVKFKMYKLKLSKLKRQLHMKFFRTASVENSEVAASSFLQIDAVLNKKWK